MDSITESLASLLKKIGDVVDVVTSIGSAITSAIEKAVTSLTEKITNKLKELFIPSDEYFDNKFDYLFEKFAWVESLVDTVNIIVDFFKNTDFSEPPEVTINLSLATSNIDYGDSAVALDLSWYAPFKPYVDSIISAILILVFAWNTWKGAPNIINGVGEANIVTAKTDDYFDI